MDTHNSNDVENEPISPQSNDVNATDYPKDDLVNAIQELIQRLREQKPLARS